MDESGKRKLNVSGLRRAAAGAGVDGTSSEPSPALDRAVPPQPLPAPVTAAPKGDGRINAYVDPAIRRRAVNALKRVGALEGVDSLSAAVEAGLVRLVEELESKYNGGVPFEDVDQRMPRGRRPQ